MSKDFCGHCKRLVARNHRAFACDICNIWVHLKCTTFTVKINKDVKNGKQDVFFACDECKVSNLFCMNNFSFLYKSNFDKIEIVDCANSKYYKVIYPNY